MTTVGIGILLFGSATLRKERLRALMAMPHPNPVFVLGNQKSGTTAIAALLAAATGLRATLDFTGAWHPFIAPLVRGETALGDFIRLNAWAFSAPIVKEPNLTFVADRLLAHFLESRAVFIVRNPWENVRSMLVRVKVPGYLDALSFPVRANQTWRSILNGTDIQLPTDHYVVTLARRWMRATAMARTAAERGIVLRYEDFCADKANAVLNLAAELRLPIVNDIKAMIDKPFQRQSGNVADPTSFFGRRNLDRLSEIVHERAREFGYTSPR
jgi:hypothetical protein